MEPHCGYLWGSSSLSTSCVCPLSLGQDALKELPLPSVPVTCSCRYNLSPGFPATVDWESLKARIRIDLSSAKLLLSGFVVASNTSVATTVWETVEPSCGLRRQSKVFQSSQAVILRKHLSCSLKVKASYKKGMNHCINYSGLQVL